jgi:hypothetical protein
VIFGSNVTVASLGSAQGLHLVVTDIEMAHAALATRGAEMSSVFHDASGVFHHKGADQRLPGPHPSQSSYGSFASFSDPDGNGWLLQEVTARLPGRRGAAHIPPKSNCKGSFVFSAFLYRYRNLVERIFQQAKQFCGIATRYDKNPDNFLAAIKRVSVRIWIRAYESAA